MKINNLDLLNVNDDVKFIITNKILSKNFNPYAWEDCVKWMDKCFNTPKEDELRLCALNQILEGYGIESFEGEWQNGYWCNVVCSYVNMGDSYIYTIILHRDKGFFVDCTGNLLDLI